METAAPSDSGTHATLTRGQYEAIQVLVELLLGSEDSKIRAQCADTLRRERVSVTDADGRKRGSMTALHVVQVIQNYRARHGDDPRLTTTGGLLAILDAERPESGNGGNGDTREP